MKYKALVIDDEPAVAETLAQILAERGYELRTEASAEAGIKEAEVFQPDLVILDVLMPRMNGVQAAIQIQQFLPHCIIILLSAFPEDAHRLMNEQHSFKFQVIAKPIHPDALLSILESRLRAA